MITILLTIDVDADYFDSSFKKNINFKNQWKGYEIGIPLLLDNIFNLTDSFGESLVATWFIRADNQIKYHFGDYSYLAQNKINFWNTLLSSGHEIGWHPHLYENFNGNWEQAINEEQIVEQLNKSYKSLNQTFDNRIKTSRIGEAFFSKLIGRTIDDLNIHFDSTALPGRVRIDGTRSFDWTKTESKPYYPCKNDYRISSSNNFNFIEVPFTMISTLAEYDKIPLYRYFDLSFKHNCIKDGINELIYDGNYLNLIIHPSTIISDINVGKNHGLLSFDINHVKKNFHYIIEKIQEKNIEFKFSTISNYGINLKSNK